MVLNQPTSPRCVSKITRAIRDAVRSTSLQNVIQTIEQMRNSLLCLVTHVRQAKGLAADLSVTRINYQTMLLPQPSRELQYVEAFTVFHAGQCLCADPFLGEEFETGAAHPPMHQSIGAGVSSIARFQAIFEIHI